MTSVDLSRLSMRIMRCAKKPRNHCSVATEGPAFFRRAGPMTVVARKRRRFGIFLPRKFELFCLELADLSARNSGLLPNALIGITRPQILHF